MPLDESCPQAPLGKWRALRPRGGCTHHARHSVLATTRRTHCHAPNTRPSAAGQRPRRLSQQLLRDAAEKIVRKAQSRTPHDTCIAHVELHQVAALEPHRPRANARAPLQRFNAVRARAPAGRHCLQQLLQLPQRSAGAAREEFRSAPAAWLGTGRGGAGAGPGRGAPRRAFVARCRKLHPGRAPYAVLQCCLDDSPADAGAKVDKHVLRAEAYSSRQRPEARGRDLAVGTGVLPCDTVDHRLLCITCTVPVTSAPYALQPRVHKLLSDLCSPLTHCFCPDCPCGRARNRSKGWRGRGSERAKRQGRGGGKGRGRERQG